MLSNHDRQVVARETDLPGMALLLDSDRLRIAFGHAWPEDRLERLANTYLNYKPAVRCLAGYTGATATGPLLLHAKAFTSGEYTQIPRAADARDETTASAPCLLDDLRIGVWRFPEDRRLAGLSVLASPERRAHWLRKRVPDELALSGSRLETLRYKPERRYVGKLTSDHAEALAKVYDPWDFENAWRAAKAVQTWTARDPLQLSHPLGRSKGRGIIVSRWLEGQPLDAEALGAESQTHRLREVGAALAEFHGQAPGTLARVSREDEALAVLAAANSAAWLCPDLAHALRRLALQVAAELLAEPTELRPIHGDFSADQVVLGVNGIGIIDYDQTRLGDPAADLGSFIARLEWNEACGSLPAGRAQQIAESLIEGYCGQTRSSQPSQTNVYVAAGLLRLAPQSFRSRLADWPTHIGNTLEQAGRFFRVRSRCRPVTLPGEACGNFGT